MPLTPKNRKEEWLQGLVDHETTLTPKNRKEEWMKEIIDASGGGGGGGGVLVVSVDNQTYTLNKTWKEINDAPLSVIVILEGISKSFALVSSTEGNALANTYLIFATTTSIDDGEVKLFPLVFSTDSENGYPVAQMG